jgi:multidrug transporter EmrE-like cation transporter
VSGAPVLYVGLAGLAFSLGAVCMKLSAGLTRWPYTLALLVLFIAGALLNALAMNQRDLGVIYIVVLGVEAVLTFGLGVALFHEAVTPLRLTGVVLVVGGIALLR